MQVFFSWAFLCHPKGWHLPAHTFVNGGNGEDRPGIPIYTVTTL